jgi:hypothetical protein
VAQVSAAVRGQFAAFRRARKDTDALPALTRKMIAAQPEFGENPALSRRVVTARGRNRFLVPGDGVVGMYDEAGGGSVSDAAAAADGQTVGTEMCVAGLKDGQMAVTGLLPDGAGAPALVLRNGRRLPLPVTDGIYDTVVTLRAVGDLPDRVEFTADGELRSVAVPGATEDALDVRCAGP